MPGIESQPDSTTCGPTCLHALYRHYGDDVGLDAVIGSIQRLDHGGTLDVYLANHALARGYQATIYTYNLEVFDPTWFEGPTDLAAKLRDQAKAKPGKRLATATRGYQEYLALGGKLRFEDLTRKLIRRVLRDGQPVLTGLSATYLYRSMREWGPEDTDDDIRGRPVGHFVLLTGYEQATRHVLMADPMKENPLGSQQYRIHVDRVIGAILLGALTYDANLVLIRPG